MSEETAKKVESLVKDQQEEHAIMKDEQAKDDADQA